MFTTILIIAGIAFFAYRSYAEQVRFEQDCQAQEEARMKERTREWRSR